MLLSSRAVREMYEARIEELKAEHRRTVDVLAEQIEYLRAQLGSPNLTRREPLNPADQPAYESGLGAHLTEEEEDLLALHDAGHITETQMEETLARLGFKNTRIES